MPTKQTVAPSSEEVVEDTVREGQEADPLRRQAILKARIKRLEEAGKDTEKYELDRLKEELEREGDPEHRERK